MEGAGMHGDGRPRRTKRNLAAVGEAAAPRGPRLISITCTNGLDMHACDLVLATYEQIRRELQSNDWCVERG